MVYVELSGTLSFLCSKTDDSSVKGLCCSYVVVLSELMHLQHICFLRNIFLLLLSVPHCVSLLASGGTQVCSRLMHASYA